MQRIIFLLIALIFSLSQNIAQDSIEGIINKYSFINEIDYCNAILTVSNPSEFSINESVIIIQMKGAEINESDSGLFGEIVNINSAGLFEKAEILDIIGNQVFLKHLLVNEYQIEGLVQMISLPNFENAIVENSLTAESWNGITGGVLALEVTNQLELNADISVNGLGFRGAQKSIVTDDDCSFLINNNDFFYEEGNWRGAPKGEGIAAEILNKEWGRGALANGGGGGNEHNAGGGGGGNISAGGIGGEQTPDSIFGCDGPFPGRGGKANPNLPNRIYLGGGGGAGHVDNNNSGSSGANGGGIILLFAKEVITNGNKISANGNTPSLSNGDGAGGGGGGGSIILDAQTISNDLIVEAKGGDGGDVTNPNDRCFGPGGGGSGGNFVTELVNVNINLSGGIAGQNSINSSPCSGLSNGAMDGNEGIENSFLGVPLGDIEVEEFAILEQPHPQNVCEGDLVEFSISATGTNLNIQWQANTGNGFENLIDGLVISGANTPNLIISNAILNFNNAIIRAIIMANCESEIISEEVLLEIQALPVPNFSTIDLGNGSFQFSNTSLNSDSYFWNFGDMNTSTADSPTHNFDEGIFEITLTAINDCDSVNISMTLEVSTLPSANFSVNPTIGCAPFEVQFQNESSENADFYEWHFEGGTPASSLMENPTVIYENMGNFSVSLIVSNSEGSDTLTQNQIIEVDDIPEVDFDFMIDGLEVEFINLSTNFDAQISWDFGDMNSSNAENPTHLYNMIGSFEVTLTAFNECGENSITQTILTGSLPTPNFTANITSDCAPVTVLYTDLSTGDITDWFWEFPGGTPNSSSEQNPTVVYNQAGIFDATLTVTNALGQNSTTDFGLVEVLPSPDAEFEFEIDMFTVNFTNTSTNALNYSWNFDDGSPFSNEENPTHTYSSTGLFNVTLTVSTATCFNVFSQVVFIEPVSIFEENNASDLNVFPNPTNDILNIHFSKDNPQNIDVQLFSLDGKSIRDFKNFSANQLDISELPEGVYLLKIISNNKFWIKNIVKIKSE